MNMIKYEQIPHEFPAAMTPRDNVISPVQFAPNKKCVFSIKATSVMLHTDTSSPAKGLKVNTRDKAYCVCI